MKNPIYYFLYGVITTIVVLGIIIFLYAFPGLVLSGAFSRSSDSKTDIKIDSSFSSPDGEYVATLYTGMGGGAAGWCWQRIKVNKKTEPFDSEKAAKEFDCVFSIGCSNKVSFKWTDENEAQISYSIDEMASLFQKSKSDDGKIKIVYTIIQ